METRDQAKTAPSLEADKAARIKFSNPTWFRCGCEDCAESRGEDSLRHSRRRINAYRALASPSLIALSSKDPILTAFKLSWELRELAFAECEFKSEYMVGLSQNICILLDDLILELKKTMSRFRHSLTGSHSQFLWIGSYAQLRPWGSSLHCEYQPFNLVSREGLSVRPETNT